MFLDLAWRTVSAKQLAEWQEILHNWNSTSPHSPRYIYYDGGDVFYEHDSGRVTASSSTQRVFYGTRGRHQFVALGIYAKDASPSVGMFTDGELGLPYGDAVAFFHLLDEFELDTEESIVSFHSCLALDYGACVRKCVPVRIRGEADLRRHGVFLRRPFASLLRNGETLWWQPWGGVLFEMAMDVSPEHPLLRRFVFGRRYGRYEWSPKFPFRVGRLGRFLRWWRSRNHA